MADFQKEVREQMAKKEVEAKLSGLEKVKKLHFHPDAFSVENDLLTPTFKVKRNVAVKKFQSEIAQMYEVESNKA